MAIELRTGDPANRSLIANVPLPSLAVIRAEQARRAQAEVERNADLIRARCIPLTGFVREAWPILEPRKPYVPGWHIDAICEHLQAIHEGRINRLLINIPPGSSKSLLVSVLFPAWEWSRGATSLRYLTTSFNDGPVKRDTRKCRDLILSDWYQALWPHVHLTRTGETSFANSGTGTREGVAFGSLTSQRGDRLIIDDPHSTETAESDVERTRTTRIFREGALDRLNDLEKSAIIVIMQRLHERDIAGVIAELPELGFETLVIPMEFNPDVTCRTSIGWTDPREYPGELMEPKRFPRAAVERLKVGKGSHAYACQYQQLPVPREGGLFQRIWFDGRIIELNQCPPILRWVRGWDLAATRKTQANKPDFTAGVRIGATADGRFVVAHVMRMQDTAGAVTSALRMTAESDPQGTKIRLPEDPGQAGKAQAESLVRSLAGYSVRTVRPTGDKVTRATPASVQAEAGNILVVRGEWTQPFIDEICSFPGGANDDQVDAFADAFNEVTLGPRTGSAHQAKV